MVSLLALVCLVPLAALTYLAIAVANRAVLKEVDTRVRTTATVTALLVQQQMQAVAELTSSYASRPLLRDALGDGDPAQFQNEAVVQQLVEHGAARPGIGGVFLTDTNCRLTQVEPPTPTIVGSDFSFRDWCQGVRATGGPYVSEAYRSAIAGNPLVVAVAVTVRADAGDRTSRPLAILAVVYTLDAIKGFTDQIGKAQGVDVTVADQRGTVLVGEGANGNAQGLASVAADSRTVEALAGRSGTTTTMTAGGDALSAFGPVDGIGWAVVAEMPSRTALAGVRHMRSTVMRVAFVVGLMLLSGVVLLARSLRQRREAQHTLARREASTRAILEAATDAFVSIDQTGLITGWNGRSSETFGWTEAEALGRQAIETLVPEGGRAALQSDLVRFLASGGSALLADRLEITAMHRDGHEFPAEVAAWPVRLGDGWGFNAFLHDITDRKRAESDLATALDQAVDASQMKSEFLANMSHEIRTPMNGVLGMTSLLLDSDLRVEQREFAKTALASGEALLAILNDILDFSKIEAGRLDMESVDFDLRSVVEDVAGLLSVTAHAKGVELACRLPLEVPATVRGDPGRLRQVLTNLVGNAVKFTSSGEVVVEMTMTEGDDAGWMARFEVVDTGIGIADADRDTVFESFSQADAGTTRRYGGTGLGLAISRQLVELMGGRIGVQSASGQGSTFWFTLPFLPGGSVPDSAPSGALAGLRMLVVDDNATNRAILTRFLQAWGIRSYAVEGAPEALDAMTRGASRGEPFDAALLDLNMPGVNSIELARAILRDTSLPPVKLVLLTSSGLKGEAAQAGVAGVAAYLTRPVRQSSLYDCLATVMGGPSIGAATESQAAGLPRPVGTGRVLLAEDNVVNQKVATAMLRRLGFQVDVAANGVEAVAAASATSYRAILMDCQMPDLDGYEATGEIRRSQRGSVRTPIIAVTASALTTDPERCLAAGMDDYLAKPLSLKTLSAIMTRWTTPVAEPTDSDDAVALDGEPGRLPVALAARRPAP
ncbi:MAG: response regulator [Actinomycetota bacterium]|nr:response regulator [Actinomycetota bacterium]